MSTAPTITWLTHEGVRRIDELYAIEREISTLSGVVCASIRREQSMPVLDSLHAWADDLQLHTMPSKYLGKALAYLLKQWPKLICYVDNGAVALDANLADNTIRSFALGRRVTDRHIGART